MIDVSLYKENEKLIMIKLYNDCIDSKIKLIEILKNDRFFNNDDEIQELENEIIEYKNYIELLKK